MTHYISVSLKFPKGHTWAGYETHFKYRILNKMKRTTIRSRKKVPAPGDQIVFYNWSGLPYRSKWIVFATATVRSVRRFAVRMYGVPTYCYVEPPIEIAISESELQRIAKDDGLNVSDFYEWFNKPFDGHIIEFVLDDAFTDNLIPS